MRKSWTCGCLMALLWVLPLAAQTTSSDDAATQQLQKEKDKAQLERDIAQAERDRAEADAAAFKARLGSINTANLPKGTTSVNDKVVVEANYLAYMAARSAAEAIASSVCSAASVINSKRLAIATSATDFDTIRAFEAASAQLDMVANRLETDEGGVLGALELQDLPAVDGVGPDLLPQLPPFGAGKAPLYEFREPATGNPRYPFVAAGAFAAIDAAVGLISLFKVDTSYTGVAVPPDDQALAFLVAHSKACQGVSVLYPSFFVSRIRQPKSTDVDASPKDFPTLSMLGKLAYLNAKASEAGLRASALDLYLLQPLNTMVETLKKLAASGSELDAQLKEVETKLRNGNNAAAAAKLRKKQSELQQRIKVAEQARNALRIYIADQVAASSRIAVLKDIQSRISSYFDALSKPAGGGATPLDSLLLAETLLASLNGGQAGNALPPVLMTKIVSIGGNNITKQNILFTSLRFSGGAIVEYALFNAGAIEDSGVVQCYGGKVGEDDLRDAGDGMLQQQREIKCLSRYDTTAAGTKN